MRYDESDFILALGVVPKDGAEGHGIERVFECSHDGLRLLVSVFQYDGDVAVSVFRDGKDQPVVTRWARRFAEARCIRDPRGDECLEIIYPAAIPEARLQTPVRERMRIYVRPQIRMTFEYDFD
jgi:hypothetical protein